jgi:hypothetical protein
MFTQPIIVWNIVISTSNNGNVNYHFKYKSFRNDLTDTMNHVMCDNKGPTHQHNTKHAGGPQFLSTWSMER